MLIPFSIISYLAIYQLLLRFGFLTGLLFTTGIIFVEFWSQVLLNLAGLKLDFSFLVIFCLSFFLLSSLYKYIYSLGELLKIKDKATLDPLREIFTLRYFYYRLELELKKIYFSKALYLAFLHLEFFDRETKDLDLGSIKSLWQKIRPILYAEDLSFWALFSQDELVGAVVGAPHRIGAELDSLKNSLSALFKENNLKVKIKIGYLRLAKGRRLLKELFFILSRELKTSSLEIAHFKDSDVASLLKPAATKPEISATFLESLDQDIEEKNREFIVRDKVKNPKTPKKSELENRNGQRNLKP